MTALLWGTAALVAASAAALAGGGLWPVLLILAASASSLLRVRVFYGSGQRAALMVAGVSGPAILLAVTGYTGGGLVWLWVSLALMGIGVLLFAGATVLPGRRVIPHYARAAELLEGFVAFSLLPLLLAVLGVYEAARNLR